MANRAVLEDYAEPDGRRQRTLRTRQAIVSALIELQTGKETEDLALPKAQEIASKAGVSLRSIFIHFPTQEALTLAVMAELDSRTAPYIVDSAPSVSFEERLQAFIERRVALLELIGPFRRAAGALAASPEIFDRRRRFRKRLRNEVATLFEPELKALKDPDGTLNAIAVLAESESWYAWRRYFGLSAKAAKSVLRVSLERLLVG